MKCKDSIKFYDAIRTLKLDDLEKIRKLLLKKDMSDDNKNKLRLIDLEIENKYRRNEYMERL